MKTKIKLIGIIALIAVIGFTMVTCDNGSGGDPNNPNNGNDPRPATPQSMSTKSALQYFTDEGITVGINVGNSLDAVDNTNPSKPTAVETAWGGPLLNQTYFNSLKNMGFKIVRIPVSWVGHIGSAPNYTVSETWLKRVAEVVNMAHTAGLKAFINIHHDGNHDTGGGWLYKVLDNATLGDTATIDKYEKVWAHIAEYFKNYGDYLMFQGFNELHNGDWGNGTPQQYPVINNLNQKFTTAVRGTGGNNATRFLLYYGYNTSKMIGTDTNFVLPTDSGNGTTRQIVGFHYYEPFPFSHDGDSDTWDNPTFRSQLEAQFGAMKTRFYNNGIPVIIGESGPTQRKQNNSTAIQNRLLFIDYMFGKARENGIVPIYWETGDHTYVATPEGYSNFNLINRTTGQPKNQESGTVLQRMITAVNTTTPPVITPPLTINNPVFTDAWGANDGADKLQPDAQGWFNWTTTGTLLTYVFPEGHDSYSKITVTYETEITTNNGGTSQVVVKRVDPAQLWTLPATQLPDADQYKVINASGTLTYNVSAFMGGIGFQLNTHEASMNIYKIRITKIEFHN